MSADARLRHTGLRLLALVFWAVAAGGHAQEGDVLMQPSPVQAPAGPVTLVPLPEPDLARTEETVAQAVIGARQSLIERVASGSATADELGSAYGEIGELYHAQHFYGPATAAYENAERLQPDEFRWPYYQGILAHELRNELDKAVRAFERARAIRPEHPQTKVRLARVYLDLGRPADAQALLEQVADEEPVRAAALFTLGQVLVATRRYQEAIEVLNQALALSPQATRIHYLLGMAYRGAGDVDQARSHLAQHGTAQPELPDPLLEDLDRRLAGVQSLFFRATVAVRDGDFEQAIAAFEEALARDPDNVNGRISLARSHYLNGDMEAVGRILGEVLEQAPDNDLALFLMAVWLDDQGRREEALDYYRRTLAVTPDHPGAATYLADALMTQGAFAEAADYYRIVVRQVPDNRPAWMMWALALMRASDDHGPALAVLEEALAAFPDEVMFQYVLARLLAASPDAQVRDGARARRLAQALFDQSNVLENAETLAMAYAEDGAFDLAVSQQQNCVDAAKASWRLDLIPQLRANLALYEAGKASREPWPAHHPVFRPAPVDVYMVFREYPTRSAY